MSNLPFKLVVGGDVQAADGGYIRRPADDQLFEACLSNEFSYVLACRQIGKSSLKNAIAERLIEKGVRVARIDLNRIGQRVSKADDWYFSLLDQIADNLAIVIDVDKWWEEQSQRSTLPQRFLEFFDKVILREIAAPIVIFIDEIDMTLGLPFTDDFFAAIRSIHNDRSQNRNYHRLTFVLLGVATPDDLIDNPNRTPFNIGRAILMRDFTLEECAPFQTAIAATHLEHGSDYLEQIYNWTNGHPYLLQKLCAAVAAEPTDAPDLVEKLVQKNFLSKDKLSESNLDFVQTRVLNDKHMRSMLKTYRSILKEKSVPDNQKSLAVNRLKLYGLAKVENGYLQVRNRIYAHIFNETWVRNHTKIDWTRVALIASLLVTMLVISIIAFDYWVETEKNEAYTSFYRTDSPAVRLTHLAHIFQFRRILGANDYDNLAREMFFGLPREEQLALFDPYLIHAQSDDLLTVIQGLYINLTDVDGTGSTTSLLEQMVKALRVVSDADQHLSTWQSRWYRLEWLILRRDIVAERRILKEEIGHWLAGRTLVQQGRAQYINALTNYDQAIALNTENPATLYERAVILSNVGRYAEALSDLNQVIGIARLVPTPTSTPTNTPLPPTDTIVPTATPTATPIRTRTPIPTGRTEFAPEEEVGSIIPFVNERFTPTPTATLTPPPTPTPRTFSSAFLNTSQRVGAVRGLLNQQVRLAQELYANAEQYQNLVDFGLIPTVTNTPLATQTPTTTPTPTRLQIASFDPRLSTIALIRERGAIVAGVKADSPLFGFRDANGEWRGFEIDLMREFASRWLGDPAAVDFVRVTSADRLERLVAGDVDIVAATMTHRKERDAFIDFSQTYYLDGQNVLVRRDAANWPATDVERIQSLNGKRIGAVTGSTSLRRIIEFARENEISIEIAEFEQYDQALQPLLAGQIDALTTDRGILTGLSLAQPDLMILLSENFSNEPYDLGVRSGDSTFADLVNFTLQEMKSDGAYDQLYEKWFCSAPSGDRTCTPYPVEVLPGEPPFTFATTPLTVTVDTSRTPIIDRLREDGIFVAGVKGDSPPFGYRNTDGEWVGFEVDLMREFARRWLGDVNAVELVNVVSSNRIPRLITREIDIIAATMTHTKARDAQIDFSQTYFLDGQNMLVRRDAGLGIGSDAERVRTLDGKIIGAVRGSTSLGNLQAFAKIYNITLEIAEFKQYDEAIQPLLDGAIDGLTTDRAILIGIAQQHPELVMLFDSNFSYEPYGLGLPQGDHRFRDLVNFTLQEMKEDGTYDQLYRYWFGINQIMQEPNLQDGERFDLIQRYWIDDTRNPVNQWQPYALELWPGANYFTGLTTLLNGQVVRNDLAPMVYIPAGSSFLGTTSALAQDINQHAGVNQTQLLVHLDAFYIDQHEVTNQQYRRCVDVGSCTAPAELDILGDNYFYGEKYKNHPVVQVTWEQANNYCAVYGKSLPTEAQWEKAARYGATADNNYLYPWGDSDVGIAERATYANSNYRQDYANPVGIYRFDIPASIHGFTEPIISLNGASPLGVLDMAGNVQEWTADCYAPNYYAQLAVGDPSALVNPNRINQCGSGDERTVRSSGFYDQKYTLTTVFRQGKQADSADLLRGFRCVASAENDPATRLYSGQN